MIYEKDFGFFDSMLKMLEANKSEFNVELRNCRVDAHPIVKLNYSSIPVNGHEGQLGINNRTNVEEF